MVGINSFIVVTEPLGAARRGDPARAANSAADSRFVVRYWRKTADGRLIFGGGESNAGRIPADISVLRAAALARNLPAARRRADRAWLGRRRLGDGAAAALSCARSRPAVWAAGGYSGQGVALAPFVGKLLAEAAQGRPERLRALTDLPIPPLPLATWLRRPLVTLAIWQGRLPTDFSPAGVR